MSRDGFTYNHLLLPYIIMAWLQLFLNLAVVGFLMYLVYMFVSTVLADVDIKVSFANSNRESFVLRGY